MSARFAASIVTTPSASRVTDTGAESPGSASSPSSIGTLARSAAQPARRAPTASSSAATRPRRIHIHMRGAPFNGRPA